MPTQRFFIEPQVAFQRQSLYVFQNDEKLAELAVYETTGERGPRHRASARLGQAKLGWQESHKSANVTSACPC